MGIVEDGMELEASTWVGEMRKALTNLSSPISSDIPVHPKRAVWWRLKSLLPTPEEPII
jgi:hypothetical protein